MDTNYIVAPTQEELVKLLKRVDEFKMQDFKPKDYSRLVFEFTTELKARNEDLPDANKKTDPRCTQICLTAHRRTPEIRLDPIVFSQQLFQRCIPMLEQLTLLQTN